jgi:hypothetical protein
MIPRPANDSGGPSREELAAYADGELRGAARARVQAWMADHPEAAREVVALRELKQVFRATAPAEPNETTWATVLERIEREATLRRQPARGWFARLARWTVPLAGAAAVLLTLAFYPATPTPAPREHVEPFPVVTPDDVEIISLADADHRAVVVGRPPLFEPIVLGRPSDMSDFDFRPDVDGMVPAIHPGEGGSVVIVAPLGWSGVDEKDP